MSKLVVLTDKNIMGYLSMHGIFPSQLHTDLLSFKDASIIFDDVFVLFINFDTGRFSKRLLVDTLRGLEARASNEDDKGVVDVAVLSLTPMSFFDSYYLFDDGFDSLTGVVNGKAKTKVTLQQLLDGVTYNIKDTEVFLSDLDCGFNEDALSKVRYAHNNKDALLDLIQVPKLI